MSRSEFPKAIKVKRIKFATRGNVIYCETCGLPAKRFHVDHHNPDGLTGKPTFNNARILCEPCHKIKTAADVGNIARAKRREAKNIGATTPKAKIESAGFPAKPEKETKRAKLDTLERRSLYKD